MKRTWRLLDTGLRRAAENLALNRAMLEARQAGESPITLRFLRFTSSALLGYHQSARQELDLEYCAGHGIEVQRRITGGGAILFEPTHLGWELYLDRTDVGTGDMQSIARRICEAAAGGISSLGVEARFRPRNDIEVHGRKISGTGGAFDGNALMYQGTLLVDVDIEKMVRVLRLAPEKLAAKAIESVKERIVSLRELLGYVPPLALCQERIQQAFAEEFGVHFSQGNLLVPERSRFEQAIREIDHPDWVHLVSAPESEASTLVACRKFAGGLLRVTVAFDRTSSHVRSVWFSGDMFINPSRSIVDLEAALKDCPLARVRSVIDEFFAARSVDMLSLTPDDFFSVLRAAIDAPETTTDAR